MVLGLCRLLLRDHHEAEDAAQQTFVSAYRSLLRGTEPRDPAPWLAAIARNECRARIRKRMRAPLTLDREVEETLADSSDLAELADRRTEFAAVTAAIAELPSRQREAVALRDFLGLSYEEVATTLSVSVPVVESLLFRARRRLRDSVRAAPRYAASIVVVPFALRAAVAKEIPDFDGGGSGIGIAGAAAAAASGAIAKLVSLPFATKAVTAVTVVAAATVGPQIGGMMGKAPGSGHANRPAAISAPGPSSGSGAQAAGESSGGASAAGGSVSETSSSAVDTPSAASAGATFAAAVASKPVIVHRQKKHSAVQEPDRVIVGASPDSPGVVDDPDPEQGGEPGAGVHAGTAVPLDPPPDIGGGAPTAAGTTAAPAAPDSAPTDPGAAATTDSGGSRLPLPGDPGDGGG